MEKYVIQYGSDVPKADVDAISAIHGVDSVVAGRYSITVSVAPWVRDSADVARDIRKAVPDAAVECVTS